MIEKILVLSLFFCLLITTVYLLCSRFGSNLGPITGILVGLLYFIATPMAFILHQGSLNNAGIEAPGYLPYSDLDTTFSIYIGWASLLAAYYLRGSLLSSNRMVQHPPTDWLRSVRIVLILYFVFSVYSLLKSGYGQAEHHWHGSISSAFGESPLFLLVKNFSNSLRVMVFGVLLACYRSGNMSAKKAIFIAISVTAFDVVTTFNRITVVFFAIFVVAVSGRKALIPLIFAACIAPFASSLSTAWPYFRSNVFSNEGFSLNAISRTWDVAMQYSAESSSTLDSKLNSIFEASNFIVLNYIVQNVGKSFDPFWGYTALVRPLTTFLPSSFWPDKPKVFGIYMGAEINSYDGLALNSTFFGESIANFPIVWPLFIFAFVLFFDRLFFVGSRYIPGFYTMGFFVCIALWRFDVNFASIGIYTGVLLFVSLYPIRGVTSNRRNALN